ncbi:Phosphomevalonate kinase [Galdieria sulphuraria]|nr:Phosphomevalonate kinase [Galdieria sulphuraria]
MKQVRTSAPGKVLLVGGYLVLERPNAAFVVTTTTRFTATLKGSLSYGKELSNIMQLTIWSSHDHTWTYKVFLEDGNITLEWNAAKDSFGLGRSNAFIECAIVCGLAVANMDSKIPCSGSLLLELEADPSFYSVSYQGSKSIVGKTGLGSSAALVSSVVGAFAAFCGCKDKERIATAAQLAHATAQQKIGSGFDVSAAVHGSQSYVRFSPESLERLPFVILNNSGHIVAQRNMNCANDHWRLDEIWKPLELPLQWDIVLGQTMNGSDTRDFVRKVIQWKATDTHRALEIWSQLKRVNSELIDCIQKLSNFAFSNKKLFDELNSVLEMIRLRDDWKVNFRSQSQLEELSEDILNDFLQVINSIVENGRESRNLQSRMGDLADVPIEPSSLKILLDQTLEIPVVGEKSRKLVEDFWKSNSCFPLLSRLHSKGLLIDEESDNTF